MITHTDVDLPELLDPEVWEAPVRLSLDDLRDQTGARRDRGPRFHEGAGEEEA